MIELEDVHFYRQKKPILKSVDIHIKKGECIGIVGANGSGKTTFARLLNGLLLPQKGVVRVNGKPTSDLENLLVIRRSIGIVFQNPDAQAIGETVEEDIVFGLENLGVPKPEIDRRIDKYLKMLGTTGLRDRNINLLSGGQKQLVNLAAVMAMEPECIVLDEPISMLDSCSRKHVLKTLSKLNIVGTSIVLITHDPGDLVDCSRVFTISGGRISQTDPETLVACEDARFGFAGSAGSIGSIRPAGFSEVARQSEPRSDGTKVNVSHIYEPGTEWATVALNDINFTIEKGHVTGIIGGIGSGKSTLASLIAGLETPTTGSINMDGRPPEPGKNVAILFQQPEDFFFEKTVRKELTFGLKMVDVPEEVMQSRVHSAMSQVGLDVEILDRSPFQLSIGEQRLVALASILAIYPEYIVLDEPTASLDSESRKKVLDAIRGVAGSSTIIYISHHIKDVLDISDRIAVLKHGDLAFAGTKSQYITWASGRPEVEGC
ncbi:MAG: ATP-binding cassette domain-containing protein [Methanosarcinales archaeon]|nr:ATP-binding cassette domain-containing protein [Methanosarcinales archaeon]